jgi:aminoglycoside phosphotransferase (APT) family kinase protein
MKKIWSKVRLIITQNLTNRYIVEAIGHHDLGRHFVFYIKDFEENEYILKIYGKSNRWCNEITALDKLKEYDVFPQIIRYGKLKDGTEWLILRKIEGVVLNSVWDDLTIINQKNIIKEMGEYLGLIHSLSAYDYYGLWKECTNERRYFERFIEYRKCKDEEIYENILKQKLPDEELLKEAFNRLVKYYSKLNCDSKARMCHRDFSGRNIIVTKTGSSWKINGIIDFEHCQPDDVFIDFASLYLSILVKHPILQKDFFKGYTKFMEIPDNFEDKLRYYLLNTGLHICSWAYIRANEYYQEGLTLLKKILEKKLVLQI